MDVLVSVKQFVLCNLKRFVLVPPGPITTAFDFTKTIMLSIVDCENVTDKSGEVVQGPPRTRESIRAVRVTWMS